MTLDEIRSLAVGESRDVAPTGYVKRVSRTDFVLHDRTVSERSRWGTAAQIHVDVAFFETHGHLPPPGPRFF